MSDKTIGWCRHSQGFFGADRFHRNRLHLKLYPECESEDLVAHEDIDDETPDEFRARVKLEEEWCFAFHGNHDEHQCHKKPGHRKPTDLDHLDDWVHECYCGVWW